MDSRADVVAIAHALTYVIWLRLANVRLPPFVSSWQCCDPLELDDLHQVGHECELCRAHHDSRGLRNGLGILRDSWLRFCRTGKCHSVGLRSAILVLLRRMGSIPAILLNSSTEIRRIVCCR